MLHTWGQHRPHHPHRHCLVTGGGLSCDRSGCVHESPCWRSCRPGFLLPVRVLRRVFRGKFLALLRQAQERDRLSLAGRLTPLAEAAGFASGRRPLYGQDWVVHSQPPTAGVEVVLKYLSRYLHRAALRNGRLVGRSEEEVSFRGKDYAHGGKERLLTLSGPECLRRWVQHVLPRGFVTGRHSGLLASRGREQKWAVCRWQLWLAGLAQAVPAGEPVASWPGPCCPVCGSVSWRKGLAVSGSAVPGADSS